MLRREGFDARHRMIQLSADLRYVGQDHALTVLVSNPIFDAATVARLSEVFQVEHHRTFGYRSDRERIQIVGLRCIGRGLSASRNLARSA